MKKDRQKLEDSLNLVLEDYSNDTKVIENVIQSLSEKGISRGRIGGIFTQSIPWLYVSDTELCLFAKSLYSYTHETKINPEDYFNEIELQSAEAYYNFEEEKISRIVLHNVDQINEYQWLCSKETYQNIAKYFSNGLLTYNPKTQRQPIKRKVGDRIVEVINVNPKKVMEITNEMKQNSFNVNAISWNVRRINGMEKLKYNAKDRTLTIEIDETTLVDLVDGMHRVGGMLKTVEKNQSIDRVTSIYIFHVDEEKAFQIIRQESKATPILEEYLESKDTSNPNTEVVKSINNKQSKNEMFNRIGLNNEELKRENKLVTFETLSKTVEHIYDLKEQPILRAQNVEKFLIELFNVVIGTNYSSFNENLAELKETSYIAHNNTFIGYVALGETLKQKYSTEWQDKLQEILSKLDFSKTNTIWDWKKAGLENNLSVPTIKKITNYFTNLT